MAISHSILDSFVAGNKRVVYTETTFDSSYPTGGEAIAASDFGLTTISSVIVLGGTGVAAAARFFQWDRANSKIVAYNPVTGHTHTAPAFAGDAPVFTGAAPAFTGTTHTHVENTAGAYAQNATTATTAAAGTVAAVTGTVAAVTGTVAAIAAATAGAATEVPNTTNLSTVVVHLQVIGN